MPEEEEIIEYNEGDGITPTPSEQKNPQNQHNDNNRGVRRNNYNPNRLNRRNSKNKENNNGTGYNKLEKKVASHAASKLGVPKSVSNEYMNNPEMQKSMSNMANAGLGVAGIKTKYDEKEGKFKVKFPLPVKIAMYGLLIFVPLMALMLFVVLFGNEDIAGGGAGNFMFGQTCTKVTVTNTGCDSNNENCTNIYSGEVDFEKYIEGVVAAQSKGNDNEEYLKLIAVATRTYFFDTANSNCTVEGNSYYLNYMDVEDSSNGSKIKKAVEETKNYIIVKDSKLKNITYGYGNIVNEDNNYYYISYGSNILDEEKTQTVSKSWADKQSSFTTYLSNWENQSNDTHDISLIGALYLITNEGYNYEEVIEYYCGNDAEITENIIVLAGVDGFINPTRYINCTSAFGNRIHPVKQTENFHTGLDIAISGGEPVFATKSGTVTIARNTITAINNCSYGYGNYVLIDHGDGTATLYAHLKYGTIPSSIHEGVTISQGEQIGQVGSTGCSTGNHLHYEVRVNGEQVDPADYLDLTEATGTCKR